MIKYYLLIYSNDDYKFIKEEDLFLISQSSKNEIPLIIMPIDDEFIEEIRKLEEK